MCWPTSLRPDPVCVVLLRVVEEVAAPLVHVCVVDVLVAHGRRHARLDLARSPQCTLVLDLDRDAGSRRRTPPCSACCGCSRCSRSPAPSSKKRLGYAWAVCLLLLWMPFGSQASVAKKGLFGMFTCAVSRCPPSDAQIPPFCSLSWTGDGVADVNVPRRIDRDVDVVCHGCR